MTVDPYRLPDPFDSNVEATKKRFRKRIVIAITFVALCVALCVFGLYAYETLRDPDFDAYADEEITISGLDEEADFTISPRDLYKFSCQQITVTGTGMGESGESKAGVVSAFGPTLKAFLATFGCEPRDFRRIKFSCKDDYDVIIRGETLDYDIYLSIASGKDALIEKQQPLRVVIPDETSGKWAYGVTRIDFYR